MSIYSNTQASFALTSTWKCALISDATSPQERYEIYEGPTEATKEVTFPVSLPAGAIITKAWLQVTFTSSPKGGVKYQRVNGVALPASGMLEVTITAGMTAFDALFSFRSHGTVEPTGTYSGSLGIGSPTLYVDYVDTAGGEVEGDQTAVASGAKGLRLPRLLDAEMHELARLNATSLSLQINIDPLSTAELRLPHGAPEVSVDDFVELFSPYGSEGIFRAWRTSQTVGRDQRVSLRHGIVTLADDIVTEGNSVSAPVGQVFASLFAMQTTIRWLLGDCEIDEELEIVLQRNHQSLLTAFSDLTAQLPDGYAWEFEQTVSPWRAHLRKMPDEDACEFRANRNVSSLEITVDRDDQCTRLYAYGAGEGQERIGLTGIVGTPYLDAEGIDERGVIVKAVTHEDIFDALTLRDVAQFYLDRHKDPTVSIRVGALDVHQATGLTMDQFHLGKLCRVPLPSLGYTVRERVVSLAWRDVIGRPADVTATLANRLRDMADELAELMRVATRGKLIGGTVKSEDSSVSLDGVTNTKSLVHYIDITGYGNTLAVQLDYTPAGSCLVLVDSKNEVPQAEASSGKVDVLKYLLKDDNGVPTVGRHHVSLFARGAATVSATSKITIKTIEKR